MKLLYNRQTRDFGPLFRRILGGDESKIRIGRRGNGSKSCQYIILENGEPYTKRRRPSGEVGVQIKRLNQPDIVKMTFIENNHFFSDFAFLFHENGKIEYKSPPDASLNYKVQVEGEAPEEGLFNFMDKLARSYNRIIDNKNKSAK